MKPITLAVLMTVMVALAFTVGPAAAQQHRSMAFQMYDTPNFWGYPAGTSRVAPGAVTAPQVYRPFQMYDTSDWAAPAGTGQAPLTALENTGIPPYKFGSSSPADSSFVYDGNLRYLRDRWSGGGPGVGGDSGLSVLGQFP